MAKSDPLLKRLLLHLLIALPLSSSAAPIKTILPFPPPVDRGQTTGAPMAPTAPIPVTAKQFREHRRLYRQLDITETNSKAKQRAWTRHEIERPVDRGINGTIQALKTQPFLHRQVLYSDAERKATARSTIDAVYSPIEDPAIRLSDARHQKRIGSIFWQLRTHLKRELGIDQSLSGAGGHIAVVQGGQAEGLNAVTLRDGSIIIHRELIVSANWVGRAVAAAHTKEELVANLQAVVDRKFTPPKDLDMAAADRVADGFIAHVIGHEMTHGLKYHGAIGRPPESAGPYMPQFGIAPAEVRAHETISDGGGAELATRTGYSPLGAGVVGLYFALLEAKEGVYGPSQGTHPAGADRYEFVYNYLAKRKDAPRTIYDGKHLRTRGQPFMSSQMKREFAQLPSPADVRTIAQAVAEANRPKPPVPAVPVTPPSTPIQQPGGG